MDLLTYDVEGPSGAPTVVLGNSLGTTTAIWDTFLPLLTPDHRVVRYDLPGHGRSPAAEHELRLSGLGTELIGLLDAVGAPTAHLVATSLGAMIAVRAALDAPHRVDSLTLICTSARPGSPDAWHERAATVRAHGLDQIADAAVERWLTAGFRSSRPDETDGLREQLATTSVEGYAACCEVLADVDLVADLPRITAPTLVIAGADDVATPPSDARRIRDAIPGARLEIVEDAGHLAVVEQPEPIARLVRAHLAAHTPPATSTAGQAGTSAS